jgi:uncharacterized protein (TIGR03083 family)
MDLWSAIAAERRALADQLEGLDDEQWAVPSLCAAWTVRDVAAHLAVPHSISKVGFLRVFVRARGSFDRTNQVLTTREAARPTHDLVADLRRHADSRFAPPGMGAGAPLTDVLVHAADIRIPLGLPEDRPVEPWGSALDFLVSAKARRGFVAGRLPALRYAADDVSWSWGSGDEVTGPASALALAIAGRDARLGALHGPGAGALRSWVRPGRA